MTDNSDNATPEDHPKTTIGKKVKLKMPPDETIFTGKVVDEVWERQSNYPDKCLLVQLIQLEDGRWEIRVGYYIKVRKPTHFGKYWWGESALMAPLQDFKNLIAKVEQKGWFNDERLNRKYPTKWIS